MDANQQQLEDISQQKLLTNKQLLGYSSYSFFAMLGNLTWAWRSMYYALIGMNMNLLSTALTIARVVDLVVAVMVGGIIEKVRLNLMGGGKYRPWLFIFMFVMSFGIAITFTDLVPGNDVVHFIVVTVGALCVTVAMSFIGSCNFGLVPMMAGPSAVDRNRITVWNYRISTIGTIFSSLTAAYLLTWIGNYFPQPMNYTVMTFGCAGFYIVGASILRQTVKPFDKPQVDTPGMAAPQVKVADMVKAVTTNSQLLIYLTAGILGSIGMMINMNIVIYYWQIIVPFTHGVPATTSFPGYYTIGQTTTTVCSFIFSMFAPEIGKKMGKRNAMAYGRMVSSVILIINFMFGARSWIIFVGLNALNMFTGALSAGFGINYALDCGEYGLWKTGEDHRLVIMSMNNLPMKIGAIIGGFSMYALSAIGFDSLQVQAAAAEGALPAFLDDSFVTSFMFLLLGVSAILALTSGLMMRFLYKIKDEDARMYAAENQRRKDEAAAAAAAGTPAPAAAGADAEA